MKTETHLYEVQFRVQLKPEHPGFFEFQCGVLIVWVYASDNGSSFLKAFKIAGQLPYDLGAGNGIPITEGMEVKQYQISCIEKARIIGACLAFFHCPIGTDEKVFYSHWPLLPGPSRA
jgi:hypothetical protein